MMEATSPWKLGGLTIKELAVRLWNEMNADDVWGRAAQLSYYFLLALFPLLLFLTALLGLFVGQGSELRENLLNYLGSVIPGDAARLVHNTVAKISDGSSGGKLSFGILAALWAASNGMGAMCDSLNAAYGIKESRSFIKSRLIAIALTVALSVLIISALVLVLYGHNIAEYVAARLSLSNAFEIAWKILQWPIVLIFVLFAFALLYYFAPNTKDQRWYWVMPGAVLGVLLWILVSLGFSLYLDRFSSYNVTYGSLGAVIVLMLWFYLTGLAILIGGEANSLIETAAAARGNPAAKRHGEKKSLDQKTKDGDDTRRDSVRDTTRDTQSGSESARQTKRAGAMETAASRFVQRDSANDSRERPGILRGAAMLGVGWLLSKVGLVNLNKRRRS